MDIPVDSLLKDPVLPPGEDYYHLRREGLAYLQQLCGASWTDFNEHDPGLTMLEALCYRLTEVGNRADQPIPALLAATRPAPPPRPAARLQPALASPPVTLTDYERLVLAQLPRLVRSITLELLPGLPVRRYRAWVEPCPPPLLGLTTDEARLRAEVLHLLNMQRNLGDLFTEVAILRPRPVAVAGHVELAAGQALAPALTSLLLELGGRLPHLAAIRVAPAESVLPYYQVAPGSDDARAISAAQQTGAALKYASSVEGIHVLRGLHLHPLDNPYGTLARGEVPVFDPVQTLTYLTVTQHGLLQTFDHQQVLQAYYEQVSYRQHQAHDLPTPQESPLAGGGQPTGYGSVQDLLPPLYGVGPGGVPAFVAHRSPAATQADSFTSRAHLMQLKGYLLLFDQLLANFCAQVEQAGNYLSPSPLPPDTSFGLVYEAPYVAPLLPGTDIVPDQAWDGTPDAVDRWQHYQADPRNAYVTGLRHLAATSRPAASSREEFLRHLLARLGYAAPPLLREAAAVPAATRGSTIATYERLLGQLEHATYHRAAARLPNPGDAARPHPGAYAESGLELFLYLLTGLEPLARKWAHHHALADLEAHVQRDEATGQSPRLVVRAPLTDFAQLVEELAAQLAKLEAGGDSADAAGPWALTGSPGSYATGEASAAPLPLHDHLAHLAAQLERFCLLDHLVLRPEATPARVPDAAGGASPAGPTQASPVEQCPSEANAAEQIRGDRQFYGCQVTVLLPAYAPRFRLEGSHGAHNRRLVEDYLGQFAPAHLLVNVLWLDYRGMRQWEPLYAALAYASGLLNPRGRSHPEELPGAQRRACHFLGHYLPNVPT